ncbi:Di-copper centre-containing protein [Stemphylium lycopersici]|nr:tyrosinase central domain-containing protein [Stemphylium lycopersici]RAR00909.1 Di-copper centre-containing protein [Stemphylium lycopersici]
MRFNTLALLITAGTLSNALPAPQDDPSSSLPTEASSDPIVASEQVDQLALFAEQQVKASLEQKSRKRATCNINNVAIRREWNDLSKKERKAYTDAVLCLQAKKAKTPASLIPGAKSRFDDFVGTHINQTNNIHFTGTFLGWHRYFTWHYEQALRNECGYKGYQPYWNWAKTAESTLEKSPMLDGSEYSMSGNGEFIPGRGNVVIANTGPPEIEIPAGSGGGCVKSGPFKDMSTYSPRMRLYRHERADIGLVEVNLGPVSLGLTNGSTISNGDGLSYNPRCLKRDLTNYANQQWADAPAVASLILQNRDIWNFEMTMQGWPGGPSLGVHGGGHYSMGGDPGRDFFVSPGEPLFYLHHAQIDRTWWIWQQLDRKTRMSGDGISGTGTFLNNPPSANTTLETMVDLGYAAGPPVPMADLMSTTEGPMCYIYL